MMARVAGRVLAYLFPCLLGWLLGAAPARADTPASLLQSFRGNVNFTGTEEVLRSKDNTKPCMLVKGNKGIYAYLGSIPSGATVLSAQLYWAASGTTPDYTVTFDGIGVTASSKRQYVATSTSGSTTYTYFSGAADVTAQVKAKGNGYYYFDDLNVDNGNPWCSVQAVVGGFSLVVIYSHPNEPFRMLNLYEGFQAFRNTSLTINLSDFNVPNPLPANVTGRIGHVTWEGDQTLSQGGEDLLFNGYEMTDSYNPKGNQFNSSSNVTGDSASYGVDFDIYTLKPPVIQPGQTTATTTYRSGQDLVLLSAEIVAMPYAANADLALAMTRTGDLTVGSTTSYTIAVSNGGIDAETGPVTVVDTLPSGLNLVSASGTGWTCTNVQNNGQTVVTCTQPGPIQPGAQMSPIVITVRPTAAGSYTNTATVSGKTGDNKLSNNTASDTGSAAGAAASAYVFTARACANGEAIDDDGCPRFSLRDVPAAGTGTQIHITAVKLVSGKVTATKMSDDDYPVSFDLAFSCLPNSGVPVSYAGRTDFDCRGVSQTISAKLPKGQASAVLASGAALAPFSYADVGRVSLTLRYNGAVADTVAFISRPTDIRFDRIFRADGTDDYMGTATDGWAKDDRYGFTVAGAPFTMRVGALMANDAFAPSFGKEPVELKGVLPDVTIALDMRLDLFLLNPKASPKAPVTDADVQKIAFDAFAIDSKFARNGGVTAFGAMDAVVRWYEAGNITSTPYLVDYLGTGKVGGPPDDSDAFPQKRLVNSTRVIGRFYPDHFVTQVTPNFACPAALNCPAVSTDPAKPSFPVEGATYARQPFKLTVTPYGAARNGEPALLSLFQNDSARAVALSAVKAPNDTAPPAVGALSASTLPFSTGPTSFPKLEGTASYSTGKAYSPATAASRVAGDWGAPTLFYLRAGMTETIRPSGQVAISSRTPANAWTPQYETGLMVIAGRLFVPNVFGSELLRLPVPLSAQYWNGSAWANSITDNASVVASAIKPVDKGCRLAFAVDGSGACKSAAPLAAVAVPVTLAAGRGTLLLQAPPRGTVGSVDYTLDSVDAPWLPSTQARATFGLYRSPLIYMREVY
jgi:uncharacterized repeat protein (TIGR01451 family)